MCEERDLKIRGYLDALCLLHRCPPENLSSIYIFKGDTAAVFCRMVWEEDRT